MGLGKTITCVALIAATLDSAQSFSAEPLESVTPPADCRRNGEPSLLASHFSGSVWGMPDVLDSPPTSQKAKTKAARLQEKTDAEYTRACRIKAKSRATLIICPLSTVSNWEDQFREHWQGDVHVVGGAGGMSTVASQSSTSSVRTTTSSQHPKISTDEKPNVKSRSLRVYVYHGNARRPDPAFLADFDAVITTYATLASEFSRQSRTTATVETGDDDEEGSSDSGGVDIDERGNPVIRLPKPKKTGLKRKLGGSAVEASSPLQSIHWFRVVLDEAQ
jgi:SWI/SNF-related matrix-associated actin-dependent regulator of chromatin subfamily A3